jgi:hypothetical protein
MRLILGTDPNGRKFVVFTEDDDLATDFVPDSTIEYDDDIIGDDEFERVVLTDWPMFQLKY